MLWLAAFVIRCFPTFGSDDPLAPVVRGHWYHQEISREAAEAEGWGPDAASDLGLHALGVDLYCYHPLWWAQGGPRRWRGVLMGRAALERAHFDNLDSTDEIREVWQRITGGTIVAVEWAARSGDAGAARQAIGVSLHAIQDFYSHSTWLDDPQRRDCTWLEKSDLETNLISTGGYGDHAQDAAHRHGDTRLTWGSLARIPAMLGVPLLDRLFPARAAIKKTRARSRSPRPSPRRPTGMRESGPDGINLDSRWQSRTGVRARDMSDLGAGEAFDTAIDLARRDSRTWLSQLDQRFATAPSTRAFWDHVRHGRGSDWTAAFNDPTVLAYTFLTAGNYPPLGKQDSGSWFLRVLVTAVAGNACRPGKGWKSKTLKVRTLDSTGRELSSLPAPIGRAVLSGPVPSEAKSLELHVPARLRICIHAFRRTAEPHIETLVDRELSPSDLPHGITLGQAI